MPIPDGLDVEDCDTLVWVTGGSSGLGEALIKTVPFANCRIINISRRPNPTVENVLADLSTPAGWATVRAHLIAKFAQFPGGRAIFVHNAAELTTGTGWAGTVDPMRHEAHVLVNAAAPLVIGEAYLAACPPKIDAGLVMLSSTASASLPMTRSVYGAGKAAIEQWVRTVHEERRRQKAGPWVLAVIPGGMDTPGLRAAAAMDEEQYPRARALRDILDEGRMQDPSDVAQRIWALVPPDAHATPVVRVGPSDAVPATEFTR